MNHRKMLYGYQYRMGELVICQREAETVRQIFAFYPDGLSYQKIAETLNGNHIPFSEETPLWNKHKIKRLLENPRYVGEDGYPPIINREQFLAVQAIIHEKSGTRSKIQPRPVFRLRPFLMCEKCGKAMAMNPHGVSHDQIRLTCGTCGLQFDFEDEELIRQVSSQMTGGEKQPQKNSYKPSEEVMRLENAVNRALEHPNDPDRIVSLILQGVSARYDCCPDPCRESASIFDEQQLQQEVSHITVSRNATITVHFQTP